MHSPIKTYNGGKNGSGTYQQIINLVPYHDFYIEGFLGSGAIFKNKSLANHNILIDKDPKIINQWKGVNLPETILLNIDAISFIELAFPLINHIHNSGTPVFIYLDPPYPFFTRRSSKKLYKFEMNDQAHEKLLMSAAKLKCFVMISSYKNVLYDDILKGWNYHEFESQTRHGKATECIYFNYEIPAVLHDYQYLGSDFRERERIKGIKKRTINKFLRMPADQRNDILTGLFKMLPGNNYNFSVTSGTKLLKQLSQVTNKNLVQDLKQNSHCHPEPVEGSAHSQL